jgi:hypothetical protein
LAVAPATVFGRGMPAVSVVMKDLVKFDVIGQNPCVATGQLT